jgi:4-hydroxy-tetrahydrodipicolinate reductase
MNIALIGHGKMGKELQAVIPEHGHRVAAVFTEENNRDAVGLTPKALADIDMAIDFSHPAAVMANIAAVISSGTPMVVGTTGWYDRLEEVRKLVKHHHTALIYAPNFSLGVNIFSQIVMDAAHMLEKYPEYDVAMEETHHRGKTDAPSGTALSLASLLLQTFRRKSELLTGTTHGPIQPHQLQVSSLRVGHVTGRHAVIFDSEADTIELIHTARSRRGFALGALAAAGWLKGRTGLYTMRDVILG